MSATTFTLLLFQNGFNIQSFQCGIAPEQVKHKHRIVKNRDVQHGSSNISPRHKKLT